MVHYEVANNSCWESGRIFSSAWNLRVKSSINEGSTDIIWDHFLLQNRWYYHIITNLLRLVLVADSVPSGNTLSPDRILSQHRLYGHICPHSLHYCRHNRLIQKHLQVIRSLEGTKVSISIVVSWDGNGPVEWSWSSADPGANRLKRSRVRPVFMVRSLAWTVRYDPRTGLEKFDISDNRYAGLVLETDENVQKRLRNEVFCDFTVNILKMHVIKVKRFLLLSLIS